MRPAIVVATAISGIVVALGVVALLRSEPKRDQRAGEPVRTPTGRPPAFHLDATPAQRRDILVAAFEKIAGDRPERLGTLKDDIALLIDEPEAVRYIVDQWHRRRNEGRYADAAFADLFRLVKRPEFVDLTAALLDHEQSDLRVKGLQAAQTQADPRLSPKILELYRAAAALPDDRASGTKFEALRAGIACGGDALPALLIEAMTDPNEEVAVVALTVAADRGTDGAAPAARRLLDVTKSPRVRLYALTLLMRLGDRGAAAEIAAALDTKNPALAAEAAHIVAKYRIAEALPSAITFRKAANGESRRLLTLVLLRLGDREAMDEVLAAAAGDDRAAETEALQLLAASGDPAAAPILLLAIDRGGAARIQAIAIGIATSQEAALAPVVARLIEQNVGHPAELDEAPKVGGEALVPRLAELLRQATEPAAQARYLSWLGQIGGKAARDAMLRERDRIPRYVDEQLRLVDLEARRVGREAPPVPFR